MRRTDWAGVTVLALCLAAGAARAAGGAETVSLARAYEHGEGVPRDQLRAASLYCDAARSGDAEAAYSLGWMYANGRGLARDDAVAASLFARAASKGHPQAQQMLRFVGEDRGNLPACMRARTAQADAMTFSNDVHLTTSDLFASLPPGKRKIADAASKAARHYEIDPRLVLAIIAAESNFQPDALSPKDALGVMQLIPATAARFNVRNRRNVVDNVRGGISYLRWLLSYYEGRVVLAVAAYNAGEKAVDRYRGVPPYRETRDYVRRVRRLFGDETHPYDPRLAEPSPILVRYHAAAR